MKRRSRRHSTRLGRAVAIACLGPGLATATALGCAESSDTFPGVAAMSTTMFACGAATCDDDSQYCAQTYAGGAASPTSACLSLPSECASYPTCACMTSALQVTWPDCYCDENSACTITSGPPPTDTGDAGAG